MKDELLLQALHDDIDSKDLEIHQLRGALLSIIAAHANDDTRPKAFYIAADAYKCSIGEK